MRESFTDSRIVLVVDDHADIRALMRLSLQFKGCHVVEATNGQEAVELASQTNPNLILMDLSMPVMNGYEATRQIHGIAALQNVPIVAISAHCDVYSKEKALAAGCIECIGKPVDFAVVGQVLHRYL